MKKEFGLLAAGLVAIIAASAWLTPWIGVAALLIAAGWYFYQGREQLSAVRELVRDPAAVALPFDDVTTRLRNRLRELETTLADRDAEISQRRQVTNAVPDGLFLLDKDGRIVWCNQAALVMHGLDAFRDVGKPIGQLIRSPEFLSYLASPTDAQPTISLGQRAIAIRVEPTVENARLLLTRDVTEREHLDRMRRDFVANVSHEMRTPLTVVSGYVETLRDLPLEPEQREQHLATIALQTKNMERLVEDLLILARLENEQVPQEKNTVELKSLSHEALLDATALSNGQHTISGSIADLSVIGSAKELKSALGNLLSNAVRYTPQGGAITLSLRKANAVSDDDANAEAVIEVADTGPGIAPEHLPRLTERFYRVDRSRSRETGGTGLGLAIVKHVVQRHKGRLEIDSSVGKGTTFRMVIPGAVWR